MSAGNRGGHGPYYVGGFVDEPIVDITQNSLIQGGITLRGYPVVAEAGNYYALLNTEYRFPIVNVDRGISTLPVFLSTESRARSSSTTEVRSTKAWRPSSRRESAEKLWFDTTFGYFVDFTFRAGYAMGLASGGINKPYFVAAFPF